MPSHQSRRDPLPVDYQFPTPAFAYPEFSATPVATMIEWLDRPDRDLRDVEHLLFSRRQTFEMIGHIEDGATSGIDSTVWRFIHVCPRCDGHSSSGRLCLSCLQGPA